MQTVHVPLVTLNISAETGNDSSSNLVPLCTLPCCCCAAASAAAGAAQRQNARAQQMRFPCFASTNTFAHFCIVVCAAHALKTE
jgi:hypothetical protein